MEPMQTPEGRMVSNVIRERRALAERDIAAVIARLEAETGGTVTELRTETHGGIGGPHRMLVMVQLTF